MNIFLAIFFLILAIVGLIFQNDTGIFVGLTLFPWQMIKILKGKPLNPIIIIISAISGSIFFVVKKEWLILILFLFIQLYNYWGYLNTGKNEDK